MNLYLHNIGDIYGNVPVTLGDALLTDPGYRVDYVLTNPPFGKKSSITFTNEEDEQEEEDLVYNRQGFWTTSSNKQLNFVQHINTILKDTGKAAVVVPDNVLFEGGRAALTSASSPLHLKSCRSLFQIDSFPCCNPTPYNTKLTRRFTVAQSFVGHCFNDQCLEFWRISFV